MSQIDSLSFFGLNLGRTLDIGGYELNSVSLYYYLFLALVLFSILIHIGCSSRAWAGLDGHS